MRTSKVTVLFTCGACGNKYTDERDLELHVEVCPCRKVTQTDEQKTELRLKACAWSWQRNEENKSRGHRWGALDVEEAWEAGWHARGERAPTATNPRLHPGCNYEAAIICNKCGWMGPKEPPGYVAPAVTQEAYDRRGDVIRKYQEILADCLSIFTQIDASGSLVDEIRKALEISAPTRPVQKDTV